MCFTIRILPGDYQKVEKSVKKKRKKTDESNASNAALKKLFRNRETTVYSTMLLIWKTSRNSSAIATKLRNDGTPRIMLFRCYDKAGQLIFHNEPLLKGRKSLGRIARARISACTIMCIHTEPTCFLASAIVCARFEEMPNVGAR